MAFGTSAPELVISVLSALNGSAEMAIGNVVGSNTFNALMIIGCTAVVLPIKVGEGTMSKEIPLVILSSLVLFFCANDVMLDQGNENIIGRIDGLILSRFSFLFSCDIHLPLHETEAKKWEKNRRLKRCLYGNLFFL